MVRFGLLCNSEKSLGLNQGKTQKQYYATEIYDDKSRR